MWYEQAPAEYAKALRFYAERADEMAAYYDTEGKPWSPHEAAKSRRRARRLRAQAVLCEHSKADRAGDVDFLGMNCPRQTEDEEATAVARAEALAKS